MLTDQKFIKEQVELLAVVLLTLISKLVTQDSALALS